MLDWLRNVTEMYMIVDKRPFIDWLEYAANYTPSLKAILDDPELRNEAISATISMAGDCFDSGGCSNYDRDIRMYVEEITDNISNDSDIDEISSVLKQISNKLSYRLKIPDDMTITQVTHIDNNLARVMLEYFH